MTRDVELKVSGLSELAAALRAVPHTLRTKLLRPALAAGARIPRDEAKRRTPVLRTTTRSGASAIARGIRKPGTVRDAIRVRTSKRDKADGNVGVYVNVKPLTRGQIRSFKVATGRGGKDNPNDPYYWRWIEFGWARKAGAGFLQAGAGKLDAALQRIQSALGPAIDKLNQTRGR